MTGRIWQGDGPDSLCEHGNFTSECVVEDHCQIMITDRSAAEVDDTCGMKYWWNRIAEGDGIAPVQTAEALEVGIAVHEDMERLAEMEIGEDAIVAAVDQMLLEFPQENRQNRHKMEVLYRRLGWFIAWALFKEPQIREKWENVGIEKELILDRTPLWLQVKPDRVVRLKNDYNLLKYIEYKSTISASKKWMDSWPFAIQIHSSLKAIEEELGTSIRYATVVGLLKGGYSPADGRLVHPYTWGYFNESTGEWEHRYERARTASWSPMPVWEFGHGDGHSMVEWVKRCGQEVADLQFPTTAPIFLNEMMLNDWITRRTYRLHVVEAVRDECLTDREKRAIFFEARMKNCRPPFGDPCPYVPLCWNAARAAEPLASGDFIKRVPHHDLEAIGVE